MIKDDLKPRDRFVQKLRESLENATFVKLTLSQPRNAEPELVNIYVRQVEIRDTPHLSFLYRYRRKDITKNHSIAEGCALVEKLIGGQWDRAHLFTTTGDWQLRTDRNPAGELAAKRPAFQVAAATSHDRQKERVISETAPFLKELGVTNAQGEARPGMADKLRQIHRFVELLSHTFEGSPLAAQPSIVVADMGSGKGYLTFATAEFFQKRGTRAHVTGVEARADLVQTTNRVAQTCGLADLRFQEGTIESWKPEGAIDLLIALHACDTATDDAIFRGIQSGASVMLLAPCCHKEVRQQMAVPPLMKEILRHGILLEREAEIVTDGLRALLLEIHGYKSQVFEFISPEHTGKNLMISAVKQPSRRNPDRLREQFRAITLHYGIRQQRLATLLGEL
ncbi:MAG: class I SAM-dependent methyltransferase [Chthoniobacteraceae bacterium]